MIEYIWAMLVGIVSGILTGLLPTMTPSLGFLLFLPLIYNDPVSLMIFALTIGIGAQFFGSQAVFYYRIAGETSSYPVLIESKNFNTPKKIYEAIEVTTYGSLIATVLSLILLIILLPSGILNYVVLPIYIKAIIFVVVVSIALLYPLNRFLSNFFALLIMCFFANYSDIVTKISPNIPIYYFDSLYSLIIIFSVTLFLNRASIGNVQLATKKKLKKFLWTRWTKKIIGYSTLGMFCGLIPQIGSTISSYMSYGIEKLRKKSPLDRIAASETANNSAIITNWIPLLIFGVPITSIEIIFLQYFNLRGLKLQSLLNSQTILIFSLLGITAGIIYFYIALKTNRMFYQKLGKLVSDIKFLILLIAVSLISYAAANNFSWEIVIAHLLVFLPIGWLFHKLSSNLLVVTVGLLLSQQIFFTLMQLYQIYF